MSPILLTVCSAVSLLFFNSDNMAQVDTVSKCKAANAAKSEKAMGQEPAPFFDQGLPLVDSKDGSYKADPVPYDGHIAPAYSAAAAPRVDSSWDLNVNASFIYWYYSQDGMDVAYVAPAAGVPGNVEYAEFNYKPGFKLGFGVDTHFDNWAVNLDYTWFHHSNGSSATSATGFTASDWFQPAVAGTFGSMSSLWGMHLDQIDLVLARPYYESPKVTISPSGGIRALWIHQGLNVTMSNPLLLGATAVASTSYSHGWAIGPKFGINSKWAIWKGLRFDGVVGSSVLFSRYTSVTNTQATATTSVTSTDENINAVRPTLDMGLGLGYGAYLFKNKFFVDVSARYDFAEYWSQNMMRSFASQLAGKGNDIGDLNMHGLTVTVRCDF